MEQHPIPQQISSYEFKLVGEMTLKQFGKAAGGIILALIVNSSHLVFFIKWPLVFVFAAGGLALAFVPYQDRPLETWLLAFIKSIYNPTIYIYKKRAMKNWLDVDLSRNLAQIKAEEKEEEEKRPVKERAKVKEFIESLPSVGRRTKPPPCSPLEERGPKVKTETKDKNKPLISKKFRRTKGGLERGRPDLKLKEKIRSNRKYSLWRNSHAGYSGCPKPDSGNGDG